MSSVTNKTIKQEKHYNPAAYVFGTMAAISIPSYLIRKCLEYSSDLNNCRKLDINATLWDRFSGINFLSSVPAHVAAALVFQLGVCNAYKFYKHASNTKDKCKGVACMIAGIAVISLCLYDTYISPMRPIIYPVNDNQSAYLCGSVHIPIIYSKQ